MKLKRIDKIPAETIEAPPIVRPGDILIGKDGTRLLRDRIVMVASTYNKPNHLRLVTISGFDAGTMYMNDCDGESSVQDMVNNGEWVLVKAKLILEGVL